MRNTGDKIAVATKDGLSVNLHFGHAKTFWVYELTDNNARLLEKREVEHYCHGQHGSASAMTKILETIKDCKAVFSAKIGDGPTAKLEAINVESVSDYAYESVTEALAHYASIK